MVQTTIYLSFPNIFIFTILVWICQNSYESNNSGKTCHKKTNLNNAPNARVSRILIGETDVNFQQKYLTLKEKAMHLLDEDDDHFANKLNALIQNFGLQENYKKGVYNNSFQKPSNSLKYRDNSKKSHYDSMTFDSDLESLSDLSTYDDTEETSQDSLYYDSSIDNIHHKTGSGKLNEKHIPMKNYEQIEPKKTSSISYRLKKFDKNYENKVAKLLNTKYDSLHKISHKSTVSLFKIILPVIKPILVFIAMIFTFMMMQNTYGIFLSILVFIFCIAYVTYKYFKLNGLK
ncbi:uncharacterized protein MKS88_000064 [Plasmodium brasilianum]|uniref:uncharacterized protein n=1 Tax=Plasmodium brasilianum TaxID=5824 RepID=UPI00350E4AFD|nr:hypothetical protein MKS88_000064 [Plasmodium brasilianum]